jgi:5-formyltetrahydrofolate cyclo-ligase
LHRAADAVQVSTQIHADKTSEICENQKRSASQIQKSKFANVQFASGGVVSPHNKAELRRQCHAIRAKIPPLEARRSSQAVCAHLSHWPPFQSAGTILAFLAFRNEIDLRPLFERWPEKRWLAPRIVESIEPGAGQRPYLVLHLYHPTRLARHRFGMLEPEATLPIVDPGEVELVLVPGVAFDRQGGRLGFGGGFYDRLLPQTGAAVRVGLTYDELVLDAIPMEPWDCRVDWLVTPTGLLKTKQG